MRTSQQNKMLEKLPDLIKKYQCEIDKNVNQMITDNQKYFCFIIEKYLGDEKRIKSKFIKMTALQRNTFNQLNGDEKETGEKRALSLIRIAFGLGITYEEAFMLFWYCGKNLMADQGYLQRINNVLLKLDEETMKKKDDDRRREALADLLYKYNIIK